MSWCVGALAVVAVGLAGCGSERAVDTSDGLAGTDAATHPSVAPEGGADVGLFRDGGTTSCGTSLDLAGCACTKGTPPRNCFVGPKALAGVGACVYGHQTCTPSAGHSEVTNDEWGPCMGSGQPTTCSAAGAQCGTLNDGCGGVLTCGTCPTGQTCGGVAPNVCGSVACVPRTCASLGITCGTASDGCVGTLDCGACSAPQTCGGGGQPGVCACVPTTCAAQGATCGSLSDGCGHTLDCGGCTAPQTCGGGGVVNTCGQPECVPTTCAAQGATCGSIPDGCGHSLDCGACTAPQSCGGGGVAHACGQPACVPTTCAAQGATCGSLPDGCGQTLDCGSCAPGLTCGGGEPGTLGGIPNRCGKCAGLQRGCWACDDTSVMHLSTFSTPTAADCLAYCNSFPDTVCCNWSGVCEADPNPLCKQPNYNPVPCSSGGGAAPGFNCTDPSAAPSVWSTICQ